jgi:hypothetical protein
LSFKLFEDDLVEGDQMPGSSTGLFEIDERLIAVLGLEEVALGG